MNRARASVIGFGILVSLGLLNSPGHAQPMAPLFKRMHRMQDGLPLPATLMAVADVDGDGILDQVQRVTSRNVVLFGDGAGGFRQRPGHTFPADGDRLEALAIGDVDGDGDGDVITANSYNYVFLTGMVTSRLWLNQGTSGFVEAPATALPQQPRRCYAVSLADLDGDGDLDAIFGVDGPDLLCLNDGAGNFADVSQTHLPYRFDATLALALGDVDGDGDVDVVKGVGTTGWTIAPLLNVLLLNLGQGVLVDVSATNLPAIQARTQSLLLADFDGDGDPDLVTGNTGSENDTLFMNDGLGVFLPAAQPVLPTDLWDTTSLSAADVEGDGDLDLLATQPGLPTPWKILLNDGAGGMSLAGGVLSPTGERIGVLVDTDADGDPDILGDSLFDAPYLLNDGQGSFVDATAFAFPFVRSTPRNLELADLDGDGDLDAFVVNSSSPYLPSPSFYTPQPERVFLNDGSGSFTLLPPAGALATPRTGRVLALADTDLDGDSDAIISSGWGGVLLHLVNDGLAGFTLSSVPLPGVAVTTNHVEIADVDADGFPDLLLANVGSNGLLLNDQNGGFTDASVNISVGGDVSQDLEAVDVDGDGDLDIAVANASSTGQGNRLLLNDGNSVFSSAPLSQLPPGSERTQAVAAGDVDGDGDFDLWWGNDGQDRLHLNDGSGNFTDVTVGRIPMETDRATEVQMGDVDGDGDLDVLVSTAKLPPVFPPSPPNHLYLNDGTGTFTDATQTDFPEERLQTHALALGDVDGDGDLDVVVTADNRNRVYVNRTRQLSWRNLPRFDRPLRLDVAGPPGGAWRIAVSLGTASIPAPPWGTLLIDPTTLLPLGSGFLDSQGAGSLTLQIPPDPGGLAGLSIYGQALVGTAQPRLTNLERFTFTDL